MIYSWKSMSMIKADADAAAELMNDLAAEGDLTPTRLVDESRPEDAVLHDEFDWDDEIAADKWREAQAGHIIRSLIIKPEKEDSTPREPVRAFFRVGTGQEDKSYQPTSLILHREEMRQSLLEQAKSELLAFQRKFSTLSETEELMNAINEFLNKLHREEAI